MLNPKAVEDFKASRSILDANIKVFHGGNRDVYRVVATELRKLLCDNSHSLIPRVVVNPTLHPLRGRLPPEIRQNLVLYIPSKIEFDGKGGSRIVALFDLRSPQIALHDWLAQDLFNERIDEASDHPLTDATYGPRFEKP